MTSIKHELLKRCHSYVDASVDTLKQAIADVRVAANEETKSSVGDKYETTRAMLQLDMEQNATQLSQLEKLRHVLDKIDPEKTSHTIELGSVVVTNHGNFYIAISAGKLIINDQVYFAVSPASPLGNNLMGLTKGKNALLEKREYIIKDVY